MQIGVKFDIAKVANQVGRFYAKQVPFAASVALNKTADDVHRVEQAAARRELDQPRPSTVKGIRIKRSNKRNLKSTVFIIPRIDKFLRYQIHGGTRPPRSKAEAVPVNIKLNRYGNIPGRRTGKLQKLLSRRDIFSGTINGVAGIWQRGKGSQSRKLKLLVAYEPSTEYQPRFNFYDHAHRTAAKRWPRNLNRALKQAIRTAR